MLSRDPRFLAKLRTDLASGAKERGPTVIPRKTSPDAATMTALIAAYDDKFGTSGSAQDKAVSFRDLFDMGLLGILSDNGTPITGGIPGGGGVFVPPPATADPEVDDVAPPAPTGLITSAAFRTILLKWDEAPDPDKIAYTEVFANSVDDLGTAVKVGASISRFFVDEINAVGVAKYYWIRYVNRIAPNLVGPFNGTGGTLGQTGSIGGVDLGPLIITADKLSQGTYPGINLVANGSFEDGLLAWTPELAGAGSSAVADASVFAGGSKSAHLTRGATAASLFSSAFPVIPNETYSVKFKARAGVATGSGFYARAYEMGSKPAPPEISVRSSNFTSTTGFAENVGLSATFANYEFTYTAPPGVYWASIAFITFAPTSGPLDLYIDDVSVGRQITASFIAANAIAVGSAAIQNAAIVNAMIANLAVDDAKIANINAAKITAGFIDAARIQAGSLDAAKITAGTITATQMAANSIVSASIAAGQVTAAKINVTSLDAITAVIGLLRTATSGARQEIASNYIKVFDASNVKRVQLGDRSA